MVSWLMDFVTLHYCNIWFITGWHDKTKYFGLTDSVFSSVYILKKVNSCNFASLHKLCAVRIKSYKTINIYTVGINTHRNALNPKHVLRNTKIFSYGLNQSLYTINSKFC